MILIIMGVAGAGKSTVGQALAATLGWPFYDADEFHPPANVERMRRGEPLTDADREPWLAALAQLIHTLAASGTSAVIACSALRAPYRARLRAAGGGPDIVRFVYLKVDPTLAAARLRDRSGHFMPADLIPSQFATLEEPTDALTLDAREPLDILVDRIRTAIDDTTRSNP